MATEARRDVRGNVGVAFLVTLIFLNVMEVIAADDDGAVHLGGLDLARENTAADGDIASEGALLIDVSAFNGFLGGLKTKTDDLVPSAAALADGLSAFFGNFLVAADCEKEGRGEWGCNWCEE